VTRAVVVLSALAALTAGDAVTAQVATFAARLEAVRVDVLVTDGGRIVRGLRAGDFDVIDNGVAQQVDLVIFEELPLDVILALDMSDSMKGERLDHLRGAGRAVLDGLRPGDQAALLAFSHMMVLPQSVTGDLARVRAALDVVHAGGQTALVDGSYAALMLGGTGAGRDLLLVFTDGADTASFLTPARVLESARRSNATVYAVSLRDSGRISFLRELTTQTGGKVVEIESTTDLKQTFVTMLDEFRQRYLVSYTPRGVSRDGWHKLQVRVKGRRATVTARAGYMAGS
jgi:VWFA-related protein